MVVDGSWNTSRRIPPSSVVSFLFAITIFLLAAEDLKEDIRSNAWLRVGEPSRACGFSARQSRRSPVQILRISPRSRPPNTRKRFVVLAVVGALARKSCVYARRQGDVGFGAERWLLSSRPFSSVFLVGAEVMTGKQNKQRRG